MNINNIAKNSLDGIILDFNIKRIVENDNSLFKSATPIIDSNNIPFIKILLEDIDDVHIEYRNMDIYYCYVVVRNGLKLAHTTTLRESIKYINELPK